MNGNSLGSYSSSHVDVIVGFIHAAAVQIIEGRRSEPVSELPYAPAGSTYVLPRCSDTPPPSGETKLVCLL